MKFKRTPPVKRVLNVPSQHHPVSAYALLYKSGDSFTNINAPCHGYVFHGEREKNASWIVTKVWNEHDVMGRKWLSYIINHSPFSKWISNTSVKSALEDGLWQNTRHTANELLLAVSAVRMLWEKHKRVVLWRELTKGGVNPDYAFLLCNMFLGNLRDNRWYYKPETCNHATINGSLLNEESVQAYMNGKTNDFSECYRTHPIKDRAVLMWCPSREESVDVYNTVPVDDVFIKKDDIQWENADEVYDEWIGENLTTYSSSLSFLTQQLIKFSKEKGYAK